MATTCNVDVSRRVPRGERGARQQPASALSVKALVRIAARALRGSEWSSIEFHSGPDGNSVRVHRATRATTARAPLAPRAPPSVAAAMVSGQLPRKTRKTLRYRRHAGFTRLFAVAKASAMRGLWARWRKEVEVHRASATAPQLGDEMMDAEDSLSPVTASALPQADVPRDQDDDMVDRPCSDCDEAPHDEGPIPMTDDDKEAEETDADTRNADMTQLLQWHYLQLMMENDETKTGLGEEKEKSMRDLEREREAGMEAKKEGDGETKRKRERKARKRGHK